ncbi:MAG TPA: beta-ketoacyl synthase N-terminal-like domain-containing protein, partial [Lentimicrobium sp.]|nr:beta-ketoacyl synthase N-terminal-like domain-containing protein [Lentimicrobium sp.]
MKLRRVVVTGLGALTPLGNTVPAYWNSLINGVSGADRITRFDASKFKTQFACEVKGFDPLAHFDRKEVRKYDPYAQYGMVSSDEAVADAGLVPEKLNLDRI